MILPALNEEENILPTLSFLSQLIPQYFSKWEILVFNDGSQDQTGVFAEKFAQKHAEVRVIHHLTPHNLGGCYQEGVGLATQEYIILVPGDNECGEKTLKPLFENVGQADILIPYTTNPEIRPLSRRMLSSLYTRLLNLFSGRKIRYYNGTVLHKTEIVRQIPLKTNSFAYQAELLTALLKKKFSYLEVSTQIDARKKGKSKAFKLSNIVETTRCLLRLALSQ